MARSPRNTLLKFAYIWSANNACALLFDVFTLKKEYAQQFMIYLATKAYHTLPRQGNILHTSHFFLSSHIKLFSSCTREYELKKYWGVYLYCISFKFSAIFKVSIKSLLLPPRPSKKKSFEKYLMLVFLFDQDEPCIPKTASQAAASLRREHFFFMIGFSCLWIIYTTLSIKKGLPYSWRKTYNLKSKSNF